MWSGQNLDGEKGFAMNSHGINGLGDYIIYIAYILYNILYILYYILYILIQYILIYRLIQEDCHFQRFLRLNLKTLKFIMIILLNEKD